MRKGWLLLAVALVGCSGGPNRPARSRRLAADSADHVMFTVLTKLTNAGVKQADLEADTAYMYEASGRTELRRVTITFYSVAGLKQSVLTADSGTYMFRGQQVEARGNVVVVKNDGSRIQTTELRYDQTRNKITTDQPYSWDSGNRHAQGNGFESDPSFGNVRGAT
jgi:LPS export ABC transporter protein LptC